MNHHLAKTYRRRRFVILLIVIFFALVFLLQKGLLRGLNPFFTKLVTPIWQTENFTADYLGRAFSSKKELYKQNILLKDALEKKDLELSEVESLKRENENLKSVLGRIDLGGKYILASILAKPNTTPYDTLIIDRGAKDGINIDDLVFAKGNVVVGEIESTTDHTARVLMYSTPGNISQVIYDSTGRYFNAHGLGNGTMQVDVTRDIDVSEGDSFFYPGFDNAPVGVVKKVEFDARDSFKTVLIKSPVNIQEERWVEVRVSK